MRALWAVGCGLWVVCCPFAAMPRCNDSLQCLGIFCSFLRALEVLSDYIFVADIFVNFRTAYFDRCALPPATLMAVLRRL